MDIPRAIDYESEQLHWLDLKLRVPLPVNDSTYQSIGCFDQTLEHAAAILILARSELYGSMFALLRVEFEALGRGLWLRHCATTEQRTKFSSGKLDRSFGDMLEEVEASVGTDKAALSSLKKGTWNVLNDYTHTGIRQVRSRHTQDNVVGSHKPEKVVAALRLSSLLALLAAAELGSYTQDEDLISQIQAKAVSLGAGWV